MDEDRLQSERDEIEGALWGILRVVYLRALGVKTPDISEQNAALDRFFVDMESDVRALMTVVDRSRGQFVDIVQESLHGAPGVDHEMLDERIQFEFARERES